MLKGEPTLRRRMKYFESCSIISSAKASESFAVYSLPVKDYRSINRCQNRSKRQAIIDAMFVQFAKSIHYTWPTPNQFKRSPCFFKYTIGLNKLFKSPSTHFSWFTAKHEIPSFFEIIFFKFTCVI